MVTLNINQLKEDLLNSLSILLEHIEDKNTDAHKDFFPEKINEIKEAIESIKSQNLEISLLEKVSKILNFKRLFPLLELAEKSVELENTIIKKQLSLKDSYGKWGIDDSLLEEIFKKHKLIVTKYVLEGIFRKGLVSTDKEAWSPIMYNMGGRIIYDYIYAVTGGWFHEDIIKLWFENRLKEIDNLNIVSIKQTAHDSNRVFKYKKEKQNITGEPDFLIEVEINKKPLRFFLEIQHVTDASIKKRDNLIQVPSHRVRESKKHGDKYIFIVPYVDSEGRASKVAVIPGPLEETKENYIKGYFVHPSEAINTIKKFLEEIRKTKEI